MTTKEVLRAARKYITDPRKWTQGAMEGGNGKVCAAGAIYKIKPIVNLHNDPAIDALANVLPPPPGRDPDNINKINKITWYNDHHHHECVLAAFDAAIEREP